MRHYSIYDIEFVKNNFSKLSRVNLASQLGRTSASIKSLLRRLKLKNTAKNTLIKQILFNKKSSGEFLVDEKMFMSHIDEDTSYLLGLLWADGYLTVKRRKGAIKTCRIILSLKQPDGEYVKKLLAHTGKWSLWVNRSGKYPQDTFHCANTILCEFLERCDYLKKSYKSPFKILNVIPVKYHPYFYRGYLDGDGCIFVKNNDFRIIFTSTIKQGWTFLESLCKSLGCTFTISRVCRSNRNSKYSSFSLYGRRNCLLLGRFMYQGKQMGFVRKWMKYSMIENYKTSTTILP